MVAGRSASISLRYKSAARLNHYRLLTGISINGVRYSTYSYQTDKRVAVSGLAGGEQRDTFAYGTNQTTVTTASGQSTTYWFATIRGTYVPTTVSRAAAPNCPASAATTVYDANGYVDYTLDWNGNKTDYTFSADGKLMSVVYSVGTPAASARVNTWAGGDLSETSFRDANGT